jgi:hypothetical protein
MEEWRAMTQNKDGGFYTEWVDSRDRAIASRDTFREMYPTDESWLERRTVSEPQRVEEGGP